MRLARWSPTVGDSLFIVCGLAGALTNDLRPGDVVIPDQSAFDGGVARVMDAGLVSALRNSAKSRGLPVHEGRLLTAPDLVTGADRALWAERGFVAADMESALMPEGIRFAVVRVILDTPDHSISSEWTRSTRAVVSRERFSETLWMARYAPTYARRAALIASATARHLVRTNLT